MTIKKNTIQYLKVKINMRAKVLQLHPQGMEAVLMAMLMMPVGEAEAMVVVVGRRCLVVGSRKEEEVAEAAEVVVDDIRTRMKNIHGRGVEMRTI